MPKIYSVECVETHQNSRVRNTSKKSDVFNSRDEIYLIFTKKNVNFIFLFYTFYRLHAMSHTLNKVVLKMIFFF